jgi:DNA invertase Pin-like site-specific DNA recombinase
MTPTRFLGYARVSTDDQARGDYSSVDMQEDAIRRHAEYTARILGIAPPPLTIYRDEGHSGKSLNRPALARLRKDAETGPRGAVVVVYKLDRLTRSLHDFLNLNAELEASGAGIASITEQFDTTTPMGRAMLAILLVFAQLERETTVQRVRGKHDALVLAGRFAGGRAPLGYTASLGEGLKEDPEGQAVVTRIFRLYTADGLSTLQIAALLNAEGVPSPAGRQWSKTRVYAILGNPIYRGIQTFGERIGAWPFAPFVPLATAEAAMARLDAARSTHGRNIIVWEWRGLVVCSVCGWRYSRTTSTQARVNGPGKRYTYYRCSRTTERAERGEGACPAPILSPAHMERLTAAILKAAAKAQPAPVPPPPPDIGKRLAELQERRRRAQVAFVDPSVGFISEDQYRAILGECDREETMLCPPPPVELDGVTLRDSWPALTVTERNAALRILVDRAEVYEDRVEIITRPTGWKRWPATLTVSLLGW